MKAGIEAGDVITAVDGKPVKDARDLAKTDRRHAAEDLGQARDPAQGRGEDRHADARRNAERQGGARRQRNTSDNGKSILPSSASRWLRPPTSRAPAAKAWWSPASIPRGSPPITASRTGDVILEVAGKSVSTPADVRKMIPSARTEGKRTVLMRVKIG